MSTVIGTRPYDFVCSEYHRPVVVAGFEPTDILQAVAMLLRQLRDGRAEVENEYGRVVRSDGNPAALAALDEVFTVRDEFEWRGLGAYPAQRPADRRRLRRTGTPSGASRFRARGSKTRRRAAAATCSAGWRSRTSARVFGTACTPEQPLGTCMVSSEGACAAYYAYGRHRPHEKVPA